MSSGPSNNWGSPDQMREVIEFNANLTRAGQKSRPGRSAPRGSSINRGGGSGFMPGRPSTFGNPNLARPGSGVRVDPRTNYTVGPTTAQTIIRPPPNVGGRSRSRSPTRAASTPAMISPYPVGGTSSTPAVHKPASPPKIRPSVLVANGTVPGEHATAVGMHPIQQEHAGREPIVSNMTPRDPSKPFIPAHLQQKSAFEAIQRISDMTGIRLERLTSDGVSIPRATGSYSVPLNAAEPDEATDWPNGAKWPDHAAGVSSSANSPARGPLSTVQVPGLGTQHSRVASYSEMDVDMDDGPSTGTGQANVYQVGTLEDSMWANAPSPTARSTSNNYQGQQTFGGATQIANYHTPSTGLSAADAPATNFQGQDSFGRGPQSKTVSYATHRNTSGNMENVKPANLGNNNQLNTASAMFANGLVQALASAKPEKKLATLKDSRWA